MPVPAIPLFTTVLSYADGNTYTSRILTIPGGISPRPSSIPSSFLAFVMIPS